MDRLQEEDEEEDEEEEEVDGVQEERVKNEPIKSEIVRKGGIPVLLNLIVPTAKNLSSYERILIPNRMLYAMASLSELIKYLIVRNEIIKFGGIPKFIDLLNYIHLHTDGLTERLPNNRSIETAVYAAEAIYFTVDEEGEELNPENIEAIIKAGGIDTLVKLVATISHTAYSNLTYGVENEYIKYIKDTGNPHKLFVFARDTLINIARNNSGNKVMILDAIEYQLKMYDWLDNTGLYLDTLNSIIPEIYQSGGRKKSKKRKSKKRKSRRRCKHKKTNRRRHKSRKHRYYH